jgi:hypothetical protein
MAKDVFQRTKPHVNVATLVRLLQGLGVSESGASQFAKGQMVIAPEDRNRLTSIVFQVLSHEFPDKFVAGTEFPQKGAIRTRSGIVIEIDDDA